MPRNRRDQDSAANEIKPADIEEDYLDVDKPLPGQNYYCISFVSPEKVLEQKELFMYYHYEQAFYQKFTKIAESALSNMIDGCEDGKVDISDVVKLKKNLLAACADEKVAWEEFKTKFEDFRYRDEDKIGEVFDKANNFRTSVRGVKVRGVFDTKREADVRAAVLQRQDPLFDVFVGQIGYWCPWDPNPTKIADIEYLNTDLNKLVKEYKANEAKKDQFYQEQKTQRTKDALSAEERVKHQQGLSETKAIADELKTLQSGAGSGITSTLSSLGTSDGTTGLISTPLTGLSSIIDMNSTMPSNLDTIVSIQEEPAITQSVVVNDPNAPETTLEQESTQLQSDDIWLARKLAASANQSNSN
jgi:Family of unknown function (DUF5832)